jgi:signal transduction histidine kinase
MKGIEYIGIALILVICVFAALIIFFNALKQQRQLHETILRRQNEKEIDTYNRIAGEYLHQQVINGRILPHLIALKELLKVSKDDIVTTKIQQLIQDFRQTENIVRNISENIFPPHLTFLFVETCQKRLDEMQALLPNRSNINFVTEGKFNDLGQNPTLLYNLYSLIDLFVTNSLHHSQAEQIEVVLKREQDHIKLEMRDNGKGFDIQEIHKNSKGRGLADLRGRATILSPQYFFDSKEGEGTYFKIIVHINALSQ